MTPTRVIMTHTKIPKPKGILWHLLSSQKLGQVRRGPWPPLSVLPVGDPSPFLPGFFCVCPSEHPDQDPRGPQGQDREGDGDRAALGSGGRPAGAAPEPERAWEVRSEERQVPTGGLISRSIPGLDLCIARRRPSLKRQTSIMYVPKEGPTVLLGNLDYRVSVGMIIEWIEDVVGFDTVRGATLCDADTPAVDQLQRPASRPGSAPCSLADVTGTPRTTQVRKVTMITRGPKGRQQFTGCAIVDLNTLDEAKKACSVLHNAEWIGRKVSVRFDKFT